MFRLQCPRTAHALRGGGGLDFKREYIYEGGGMLLFSYECNRQITEKIQLGAQIFSKISQIGSKININREHENQSEFLTNTTNCLWFFNLV